MKRNIKYFVILFFIVLGIINAQEYKTGNVNPINGKISGYLFDANTSLPIEYGNIAVFSLKDSSLITGTVSSKSGFFEIENLKSGRYFCKASFIGYESKIINDLIITPKSIEIELGEIKLSQKSIAMSEVEVSGQKEMYTYNIEKKVINVDKMLTSVGGTAVDILQNIPSVNVDADGTVSLRGNTNLTILIDGKPNGMVAVSPEDALAQIPASAIESVELVTNPSAKYDPEGTGGIINIILKKNIATGFNGSISANAGTRDKYNGSLNLNYRVNGFNFFGSFDRRSNYSTDVATTKRTSAVLLEQNSSGTGARGGSSINTGFDYFINNYNTLTFSFQKRSFGGNNVSNQQSLQYPIDQSYFDSFSRNSNSSREMNSNNYAISYKKTYDEKQREFTIDLNFSKNNMEASSLIEQINFNTVKQTKTESKNKNNQYRGAINYIHPFSKFSKLELGAEANYRNPNMHFNYLNYTNSGIVEDLEKRNYFDYKLQTYALYATYSSALFEGFAYQLALRGEQAYTKSTSELTGYSYSNNYFSLYPSLHLSYQPSLMHEIQFSYSRRVDRPSNRQLNPFVDYSDSLNISYGNPFLKPQYINSYEISYGLFLGKTSLTTSFFVKNTNDVISSFSRLGDDGINRTTFENIAKSTSYGTEFIAMQPVFAWWRLNANVSVFKYTFENNGTNVSAYDNFSWSAKLNNSFSLGYDIQLQLMLNYNSPSVAVSSGWGGNSVNSQTKLDAVYFADLAIKKDFMDGNLSVLLRVSDIFNSRRFNSTVDGFNFISESSRSSDSRNIFLGISYRLNMGKIKEREKPQFNENDDF
ncbi:MAG TPA: outer membrane beta-barrel family protein [Melioribacteraceae bacterium]|nr:outer membrane beta-barrel family protein [Melioribacteraceae bacterium]